MATIKFSLKSSDFGSAMSVYAIVDGVFPKDPTSPVWMILQDDRVKTYITFPKGVDPEIVKNAVTPYWMGRIETEKSVEWVLSAN